MPQIKSMMSSIGDFCRQCDVNHSMCGKRECPLWFYRPMNGKPTNNYVPKPDGVTDETWDEYLQVREAKRYKITIGSVNRLISEANKAGVTLQEALEQCNAMGWVGFMASWLKKSSQPGVPKKERFAKKGYYDGGEEF